MAIRHYMQCERRKGANPAAVANYIMGKSFQENATFIRACGAEFLTYKHCHNVARNCHKDYTSTKALNAELSRPEQERLAMERIRAEPGWKVDRVEHLANVLKKGKIQELHTGFVFAHEEQLQTLCQRGFLTLMDSTHCTNKVSEYLFTLMVRDNYCRWIPVAHMMLSNQTSELIACGLRVLRHWCHSDSSSNPRWNLNYMLTDDSAAEQRSVQLAWADTQQAPVHLLCTTHLDRSLAKNLKGENAALRHMKTAIHTRRSKAGAQESFDAAVEACLKPGAAQYLQKYWGHTIPMWANAYRQHCCLLLQV